MNQKFILRIEETIMTAVRKMENEPVLCYFLKRSNCWKNPKHDRKIMTIWITRYSDQLTFTSLYSLIILQTINSRNMS